MRFTASRVFYPVFALRIRSVTSVSSALGLCVLFSLAALAVGSAAAQPAKSSEERSQDISEARPIPNHVPLWASPEHFVVAVPDDENLEALTLVLDRGAEKQAAFEKLLADQQDPSSPNYHQWLTPSQIGERYGLSTDELNSLTEWLQSQGLHVDWVAPGRNFIGFSGAAGDVARAFQAELNYYDVEGDRKMSVATDPMVPGAFAAKVKAVRGLYTIEDKPLHKMRVVQSNSPEFETSNGARFLVPQDFQTIYNINYIEFSGLAKRVAIVGRSRVDFADFENFNNLTGYGLANPVEIIPTKFGGVDPGPPFTRVPTDGQSIGDQGEATLDVFRAGATADTQEGNLILIAATAKSGGIGTDTQFLVQTSPILAAVISISFGACESEAGKSGVDYWNGLFEQAAGEGISVFVASGDSGALGCDLAFSAPPTASTGNSPNYICSSSYATCVGGTEFNDVKNPNLYWSQSTGFNRIATALRHIPEGAWNEPLDSKSNPIVASSGGGVSHYIPTPAWQTGKGVPAARAGRYTPDVAFSASQHDSYFACFAAGGGSCVVSNGYFNFVGFAGTSAAAPGMAGIAALLDAKLAKGQGNLNPQIYSLATKTPSAFYDATIASSGISECKVDVPSMCNNSVPGHSGLSGGRPGYLLQEGYDEATGFGSLNVSKFVDAIGATMLPIVSTGEATVGKSGTTVAGTINPNGLPTRYWLEYSTDAKFTRGFDTVQQNGGAGTLPISVSVSAPFVPATKYYFRLMASNGGGTASGTTQSVIMPKEKQRIVFSLPRGPFAYGHEPISLYASSSSELPVTLSVVSGPAKMHDNTLTLMGAGQITIAATQSGSSFFAAAQITQTMTVKKATLTVTALNESMTKGAAVPALNFSLGGLVNGDTATTAKKGLPALMTTATSASKVGKYPITITAGDMTSKDYFFEFVNGTITVNP